MVSSIKCLCAVFLSFIAFSCSTSQIVDSQNTTPIQNDKIFVLAGQSYPSTRDYYESKVIPLPAGFSDYVIYNTGTPYKAYAPDAPRAYGDNEGLMEALNWGSGFQCVACNLQHEDTKQAIINIGLYMGGPEYADGSICTNRPDCNVALIAKGKYDSALTEFSQWANSHKDNLIFLRIGYEFDGPWNGYAPEQFKAAFKYIRNFLSRKGVQNVEYVYHSFGYASRETLEKFYPEADEYSEKYVDWIGYSYFTTDTSKVGEEELAFARELGMSVLLGEVAPHTGDCKKQIDVTVDIQMAKLWIDNFVEYLDKNRDVIRGIAYINEHWSDTNYSPMWQDQQDHNCGGFFSKSNSQLSSNPEIEKYWADALAHPMFVHAKSK